MTDIETTVDSYLDMWNETDPRRRDEVISRAWTTDGHYVDPLLEAAGHDALSEMVNGVQAQFPGHRFRRTTAVDTHHDRVRFGWELAGPDGTVAVAGIDVGVVADGKLSSISGFFGDLTPADAR
jgi:hypothetical protein